MDKATDDSHGDTSSLTQDLPHLIRLLDDDDPAVWPVVSDRFSRMGGDISHDLAALGISLQSKDKQQVSHLLAPARRQALKDEWLVPSDGVAAMADDWDSFENRLRQISDFLHDGITLRPSLSDSLDMLVDEISADLTWPSADELRKWLFSRGRFKGVKKNADGPVCYDLVHVIECGAGNPTSLGCLFMLLGNRLGLEVDGCNYPGHFLTRIRIKDVPHLIDGYHRGRKFNIETLLQSHPEISDRARSAIEGAGHLGLITLRYLTELQYSLKGEGRHDDALLFKQLTEAFKA